MFLVLFSCAAEFLMAPSLLQKAFLQKGGIIFSVTVISISDHSALAQFCKDEEIEFVVVGPEAPLAAGKVLFCLSLQYIQCQRSLEII